MSDRRHFRSAYGRTASRGSADGGCGWRAVLGWLAVLAILVQTTVPDFAMAARRAAQQRAEAITAHQVHAPHHDGAGQRQPEAPVPANGHEHAKLCAFCLALAAHGLAAASDDALHTPATYGAAPQPVEQGIRPQPLFRIGHNPRAPPASALA
ncbi:DUF2946 family protein [Azospirillum sp.]|uniref:DUF2946 family protein n=1 Tax=Azospirillum sp. TaxID=34012 RepID=UPI002D397F5D|nr:DUF2946 family protein [Azospirillum sp.]HYD70217.1 DUF2946 family protein [Azospirillum sp.]